VSDIECGRNEMQSAELWVWFIFDRFDDALSHEFGFIILGIEDVPTFLAEITELCASPAMRMPLKLPTGIELRDLIGRKVWTFE
jgi:hypothetical protein